MYCCLKLYICIALFQQKWTQFTSISSFGLAEALDDDLQLQEGSSKGFLSHFSTAEENIEQDDSSVSEVQKYEFEYYGNPDTSTRKELLELTDDSAEVEDQHFLNQIEIESLPIQYKEILTHGSDNKADAWESTDISESDTGIPEEKIPLSTIISETAVLAVDIDRAENANAESYTQSIDNQINDGIKTTQDERVGSKDDTNEAIGDFGQFQHSRSGKSPNISDSTDGKPLEMEDYQAMYERKNPNSLEDLIIRYSLDKPEAIDSVNIKGNKPIDCVCSSTDCQELTNYKEYCQKGDRGRRGKRGRRGLPGVNGLHGAPGINGVSFIGQKGVKGEPCKFETSTKKLKGKRKK